MNLKIVDSWLREHLETKASMKEIARKLSLSSVSVEKIENETYDIEVTTNRVDLMSVLGIARECQAVLKDAKFHEINPKKPKPVDEKFPIEVKNNDKLVNRICAVVLEVEMGQSPAKIKDRLEKSGIRSLNNLVDVTNYVMREVGHPTHVFDFDLISEGQMVIRESKQGEEIVTLDGKKYRLFGGDIVADNGKGEIIDLLGVMGTDNSVVRDSTRKILFFIDNNNPTKIRKTSMSLGIRSEAAILNEKGVDPELALKALYRGIELFEEIAKGKVVSSVLDIYPNKAKTKNIKVSLEKINKLIGEEINPEESLSILSKLGFGAKKSSEFIEVEIPTGRVGDVSIEEDIVEEIARVYGYHNIPGRIPSFQPSYSSSYTDRFFFEERVKNALKYYGFSEVYSYSLVSEDLYDGPTENALRLKNPISEDMTYLRNSLVPSLLQVVERNKSKEQIRIFEIANTYQDRAKDLPLERLTFSGVVKKDKLSFYEVKGILEQVLGDIGIHDIKFKNRAEGTGANIFLAGEKLGYLEVLDLELADFELDFDLILERANIKKIYKPIGKFPPVVEDITFVLDNSHDTDDLVRTIKAQSSLVSDVSLKDVFGDSRTFHVIYQSQDRNLTSSEVGSIREKIVQAVKSKFRAEVK